MLCKAVLKHFSSLQRVVGLHGLKGGYTAASMQRRSIHTDCPGYAKASKHDLDRLPVKVTRLDQLAVSDHVASKQLSCWAAEIETEEGEMTVCIHGHAEGWCFCNFNQDAKSSVHFWDQEKVAAEATGKLLSLPLTLNQTTQ